MSLAINKHIIDINIENSTLGHSSDRGNYSLCLHSITNNAGKLPTFCMTHYKEAMSFLENNYQLTKKYYLKNAIWSRT